MTTSTMEGRRYRFSTGVRTGLFGAIPPTVFLPVGAGGITAWVLIAVLRLPIWAGIVPLAPATAVCVIRYRGVPLHRLAPHAARWAWRRSRNQHRWIRPVPLITPTPRRRRSSNTAPAALAGLELLEVDTGHPAGSPDPGGRVAVIRDRRLRTLTAVLPVAGDGQFALDDPAEQDARLEAWGMAIGGFCREGSPVTRVAWHEWTSPTGVEHHIADVQRRWVDEPETAARTNYLQLVEAVAPTSVRHEVLVTVTIDQHHHNARSRRRQRTLDATVTALLDEARLFAARVEQAGLHTAPMVGVADLVTAWRTRSDPTLIERLGDLRRSLAARAGVAAPDFAPVAVEEGWGEVRVDGSVHRTWWFARWPRRDVPAGWMDSMLFGIDGTRTITVIHEPVPPSKSDRDIDREAITRAVNAADKQRRGFRVRHAEQRAERDVLQREEELTAGYPEVDYLGLLTVTAATLDELDRISSRVEQAAATCGVELHVAYSQQATGWVASLPLGRTTTRRR